MFGELRVGVKNLLTKANTWTRLQTHTFTSLASTTTAAQLLQNTSAATVSQSQVSPATQWRANGWRTVSGGSSRTIDFRSWVGSSANGSSEPIGEWRLDYSQNSAAYVTGLQFFTNVTDGLAIAKFNANALTTLTASNSSTIDTLQNLSLVNPSGTRLNTAYIFGSTIRGGHQVTDQGVVNFYSAGSNSTYQFKIGSTIGSQQDILQISSVGLYNYGGSYNTSRVTAGQSDTTPPAFLNTYGSLALKGTLKTANATLDENETMIYCDASNANVCTGTPTACNTYVTEGTCNAHTTAGCSWFAGFDCSGFGDQSSCEAQSGCTWGTTSCGGFTDQSSCEAQSPCAWVPNDCSSYVDQGNCESNGCTWNFSDCATSFFDESSCNAQAGCNWNGSSCDGQYNTSCSGSASTGNCTGVYPTGPCTGTYGAACQGTASCSNFTTSGSCATEAGCSWVSGMTITLPLSSAANKGNTSRLYSVVNIGATGTVTVVANTGDSILGYGSGVVLNAQNERVMLHHHLLYTSCAGFVSEGTCNAQSGCSWTAPIVCADYVDESSCNAQSGAGCSWDGSSCTGAGTPGSCNGTYISGKPWIIHQLSN